MKYKNMALVLIGLIMGFNAIMAMHVNIHHDMHRLQWYTFTMVFMLAVINLFHFLDKDDEE